MPSPIKIQGANEIKQRLRELEAKVAKKHTKAALRVGAKVILNQARANAPVVSGQVRRAIKIKVGRSRGGIVSMLVQLAAKAFNGKIPYGMFVEFGHFMGKRLKGKFKGPDRKEQYAAASTAAGRKFVPGLHFISRAYDSRKAEALAAAQADLLDSINQEAKA
jgi:HK97 gp10 family phage protein